MCCRVNRCCFCFDHLLGVKILAIVSILVEIGIIVFSTLYLPRFLFAIAPTMSIGIFCDIFLLVAIFKASRWFVLPWLIYVMILIVGLGLAAVLRVVIPLGSTQDPDWLEVCLTSAACLAFAGLLLYFWIVVLELFIKLGPVSYEGSVYAGAAGPPAGPGPYLYPGQAIPIQQYSPYQPASIIYQTGPPVPPHMMR